MITLLMALFIVMWSMATVNTSKFEALSKSLSEAFSGKILPGGEAVMQRGASDEAEKPSPTPPIPTIVPVAPESTEGDGKRSDSAEKESEDLEKLKREIDTWSEEHGLAKEVQTSIAKRGLVVTVLTDRVLFASGQADLKPASHNLLDALDRKSVV